MGKFFGRKKKQLTETLKSFSEPRLPKKRSKAAIDSYDNILHNLKDLIKCNKIYDELEQLPSQTWLNERMGLYRLSAKEYSGRGEIWDIGTAAGGPTYCLARGIEDNAAVDRCSIKGFDLFGGYALKIFSNHPLISAYKKSAVPGPNDLGLFQYVNSKYSYVTGIKINLTEGIRRIQPT